MTTKNYKTSAIIASIAVIGLLSYGYVRKSGVFAYKYGNEVGAVIGVIALYSFYKAMQIQPIEEHYGGPIRNTRKIPMTDCYTFCDTNYGRCTHMYPGDNVGKCDAQWKACRMECYFPNVQRMY